jgi:hypothetical protein
VIAAADEHDQLHRLVLALRVRHEVGNRGPQPQVVRMGDGERLEAPPDHHVAFHTQDGARDLVQMLDDAGPVQHDHAVLDALHHRFELRLGPQRRVDARPLDRDGGLLRRDAPLSSMRLLRLLADARHEMAGQYRHQQEHRQRKDIPWLSHGERELRLDEEEIPDQDAQDCCDDGWAQASDHGRQEHRDQEDEAGVVEPQEPLEESGNRGGHRHGGDSGRPADDPQPSARPRPLQRRRAVRAFLCRGLEREAVALLRGIRHARASSVSPRHGCIQRAGAAQEPATCPAAE